MYQGLAEQSHSSDRHGYESVCAKVKAFKMIHQCHHVNAFAHRARVPQRLKPRSQSCCRRFASLPRSGSGRRPLELLKNLMHDDLLVSAHRQAESPLMRPPGCQVRQGYLSGGAPGHLESASARYLCRDAIY